MILYEETSTCIHCCGFNDILCQFLQRTGVFFGVGSFLLTINFPSLRYLSNTYCEFHFTGLLDTVRMVNLFMDDESIMPVVLEEGDITIKIDNATQSVSGTPLNDSLYKFIDKHNQLSNRMNELSHRQSQMLLDGVEEGVINQQLSVEAAQIAEEEDMLVTKFIVNNFDNVLGPGVFMMITSQYRYPILTPQIEDIMSKATRQFKEDPYVREYYRTAQENEARMNGLEDDGQQAPPPPAAGQPSASLTNVPQQ